MNIIVCMKRVPDTSAAGRVTIDSSGLDIEKKLIGFKTNEWDDYALEEAVKLCKLLGGTITAVTVGTKECDDMLRKALALGADRAVRIDEDLTLADSHAVAEVLRALVNNIPYDLVLFGMQSEDCGAANLGVMVAEMLGIPHAAGVVKAEAGNEKLKVWRELEGGAQEIYSIRLPTALTIQTGINHPRYPSFLNIRKAKDKELRVMSLTELGLDKRRITKTGSLQALEFPRIGKHGEIISGSSEEAADKLTMILNELGAL
jgi:electron transfer flavoprotein beta subunit